MSLTENLKPGEWEFTPDVVKEFDTHVNQSVPHYSEIQTMISEISDWLLPNNGIVADLGASTGTTIDRIAERHPSRKFNAYLYDVKQAMLDAAKTKLSARSNVKGDYYTSSITNQLKHRDADLTIACLTLQFLSNSDRKSALKYAHYASKKGAGIIVVEKVYQSNPFWQEIATDLTQERKETSGLTAQEVRDKQAAIRGVLRAKTTDELITELRETGWGQIDEVFRWHNWIMLVARAN